MQHVPCTWNKLYTCYITRCIVSRQSSANMGGGCYFHNNINHLNQNAKFTLCHLDGHEHNEVPRQYCPGTLYFQMENGFPSFTDVTSETKLER